MNGAVKFFVGHTQSLAHGFGAADVLHVMFAKDVERHVALGLGNQQGMTIRDFVGVRFVGDFSYVGPLLLPDDVEHIVGFVEDDNTRLGQRIGQQLELLDVGFPGWIDIEVIPGDAAHQQQVRVVMQEFGRRVFG